MPPTKRTREELEAVAPLPESIAAELAGLNCQYAFYCRRRKAPPLQSANQELFISASLIKLPILFAWVYLESQGRANRDEICELDLEPGVQGAGISWLLRTRRLPFHDVLLLMMTLSDNLCANLVIQRIGMVRLNSIFRGPLGLQDAVLNRKMMDFAGRQAGCENYLSARDCVQLYRLRDSLNMAEQAWIEPMLQANPEGSLWLRDLPPDRVSLAHKRGALEGVLHEWAYTRDADFFLLAQGIDDYAPVYRAFGRIGEVLLGQVA